MINTIILCALASIIVSCGVGTILRKGGAADDDPPRRKPVSPVDQEPTP